MMLLVPVSTYTYAHGYLMQTLKLCFVYANAGEDICQIIGVTGIIFY